MDRNRFNAEVRPYLTKIRIGQQGIAFDRLDPDAWVDHYKSRNERSGQLRGDLTWDANSRTLRVQRSLAYRQADQRHPRLRKH